MTTTVSDAQVLAVLEVMGWPDDRDESGPSRTPQKCWT